jgi:hypothetical protein
MRSLARSPMGYLDIMMKARTHIPTNKATQLDQANQANQASKRRYTA